MLCEECNENEATIHFEQMVNGKKTEHNLCPSCAITLNMTNMDDMFQNIIGSMFAGFGTPQTTKEELRCSECGLSFSEFKKFGKLGCAHCYKDFNKELEEIFKNVQTGTVHQGKTPHNLPSYSILAIKDQKPEDKKSLKDELEKELEDAVAVENYEEAALLRDQIKELDKGEN